MSASSQPPHILVVGGGYVGMYAALRLQRRLRRGEARVTVVDPPFVFVGGGYAGVEALAELQDMAIDVAGYYDRVSRHDMRWVLVEAAGRILPEVSEDLGRYTVDRLRESGIEVRLNSRLESCVGRHVVLSDGEQFDASTIVWTAGVKPSPLLANTDLPLDDKGRVRGRPTLQVDGVADAWAAGDCAAIPDLTTPGQLCSPSAQHAVRQAKRLGTNIVRVLRGEAPQEYRYHHVGSVASLGLHRGVAQVYGVKVKYPAWFMHRAYHLSRVPTTNRKIRIALDWTLGLFFRREVVSLGSLQDPQRGFREVAALTAAPGGGPSRSTPPRES